MSEAGARKLSWKHEMFDDVTDERVASCALTAVHIDVDIPKGGGVPAAHPGDARVWSSSRNEERRRSL